MNSSKNESIITIDLTTHDIHTPLGLLLAPQIPPPSTSHSHSHSYSNSHASSSKSPTLSTVTRVVGWNQCPHQPHQQHQHQRSNNHNNHSNNKHNNSTHNHYTNATWSLGTIQRSGRVRIGDRLVMINGISVVERTFENIMSLLSSLVSSPSSVDATTSGTGTTTTSKLTSLGFIAYRNEDTTTTAIPKNGGPPPHIQKSWNLTQNRYIYSFSSNLTEGIQIKQEHIPRGGGRRGGGEGDDHTDKTRTIDRYALYQIQCQLILRPPTYNFKVDYRAGERGGGTGGGPLQQGQPPDSTPADRIYNWSVWKRYSELESLHSRLVVEYEWQLKSNKLVTFPSPKHLRSWWTTKLSSMENTRSSTRSSRSPRSSSSSSSSSRSSTMVDSGHVDARGASGTTGTGTTVSFGSKSEEAFLQQRQLELQSYWNQLQPCTALFDFGNPSSHRYAYTMAEFLRVRHHWPNTMSHPTSHHQNALVVVREGTEMPIHKDLNSIQHEEDNKDEEAKEVGIQSSDMSLISQLSYPSTSQEAALAQMDETEKVNGTPLVQLLLQEPSSPMSKTSRSNQNLEPTTPGSVASGTSSRSRRTSTRPRPRRKNQAAFQRRLVMDSL